MFDNHDNIRSIDRYGDGVHNGEIAKLLAAVLLCTRATALLYQGEELGMVTTTPARREDVKDPIGITGWPKEKGRDGERTPMQWDASNARAGFSSAARTWLPVPGNYVTLNAAAEQKDPSSQLRWFEQLIRMRRDLPALHDGGTVMLDPGNANVLSFLRTAPAGARPVVVSLNMSAVSQTVSLELPAVSGAAAGKAKTLLTDDPALAREQSLGHLMLAPYASWIGSLE